MDILKEVNQSEDSNLENLLSHIYNEDNLAAMVVDRYPIVPFISEYSEIISESVKAHFLGLHHIATSGLIPVVEGAARNIAESKGIKAEYIKQVFIQLIEHSQNDVVENQLGMVSEIVPMLESFRNFATKNLYANSRHYPFRDNTNRHGILHGAYSDEDYGSPLNFYKAISAIDVLCFIVSIRAPISFFAPDVTAKSENISKMYRLLKSLDKVEIYG
jgi:hypothetical protein